MSDARETFSEFIVRNPHFQPVPGETMASVYRKEHEAFIQYVDEQVAAKLAEIDVALEKGKLSPVVGDTIPYSTGMA